MIAGSIFPEKNVVGQITDGTAPSLIPANAFTAMDGQPILSMDGNYITALP